jgi:hypothetical protein
MLEDRLLFAHSFASSIHMIHQREFNGGQVS